MFFIERRCKRLTSNASEELSCKALNMCTREWYVVISLEKVEHALPVKISDYTDMIAEIEAVPQMYAPVSVMSIVRSKCGEDSQFDTRRIPVFLD